jgi:hypothetical protein
MAFRHRHDELVAEQRLIGEGVIAGRIADDPCIDLPLSQPGEGFDTVSDAAARRTAKNGESEPILRSALMRRCGSRRRLSMCCDVTNSFCVRSNNCCPKAVSRSGGLRPSNSAA